MDDNSYENQTTRIEVRITSGGLLKEKSPIANRFDLSNEMVLDAPSFDDLLEAMLLTTRREIVKFMKKAKILDKKGRWIKK